MKKFEMKKIATIFLAELFWCFVAVLLYETFICAIENKKLTLIKFSIDYAWSLTVPILTTLFMTFKLIRNNSRKRRIEKLMTKINDDV